MRGLVPTTAILTNPAMLYIAIGILGATVMPHNLYLHSSIVQTRDYGHDVPAKREAVKMATIDGTVALALAFAIKAVMGLRVSEDEEITGIDQTVHAESGYELTGIGAGGGSLLPTSAPSAPSAPPSAPSPSPLIIPTAFPFPNPFQP